MNIIKNEKKKRLCFKKRRICILKKAMQITKLTGCEVSLQVYWKEDGSLIDYQSNQLNQNVVTSDVS